MPRKRRRTAFLAISETSGIAYSATATKADNLPNPWQPSQKYLRISHAEHSLRPQHLQQTLQTPNHPLPANSEPAPTFSRFQLRTTHIETNDDILSPDSRASPPKISSVQDSDPIISPSPLPLPPPTKRSAKPHLNPAADLTPAPEFVPVSTPPTALVARSLLDAMNQTLPLEPDTPDNAPAQADPQTTPLLLGNSAIRSAQKQLGMTPTSPTSELVPIPESIERQLRHAQVAARRLCFSTDASIPRGESGSKQRNPTKTSSEKESGINPKDQDINDNFGQLAAISSDNSYREANNMEIQPYNSPPLHSRRRLSGASAVTPIPICFESPLVGDERHDEIQIAKPDSRRGSNTPNGRPPSVRRSVASPVTPQQGNGSQEMQIHSGGHSSHSSHAGKTKYDAGDVAESAQHVQEQRNLFVEREGGGKDSEDSKESTEKTNFGGAVATEKLARMKVDSKSASSAPNIIDGADASTARHPGVGPAAATSDAGQANTAIPIRRKDEHSERESLKIAVGAKGNQSPVGHSSCLVSVQQTDQQGNPSTVTRCARTSFRPSLFTKANGNPLLLPEMKQMPRQNLALFESVTEAKSGAGEDLPQVVNAYTQKTTPGLQGENPLLNSSLFVTGKGNPVHLPISESKRTPPSDLTSVPSLFTTGRGIPVNFPRDRTDENKSLDAPISLFTTGKGRPVQVPGTSNFKGPLSSKRLLEPRERTLLSSSSKMSHTPLFQPLFSTGERGPKAIPLSSSNLINNFDNINPLPKTRAASCHFPKKPSSLFSTGSGKMLTIKRQSRDVCTLTKDIESLFANGLGKTVSISEQHLRDPSVRIPAKIRSPCSALHSRLRERSGPILPARTPQKLRSGTPLRNEARRDSVSRGLRTTPFKRPRQISRPKRLANSFESKKLTHSPVPKFSVPALLKGGNISCQKVGHVCGQGNPRKAPGFHLKYLSIGGFHRSQECQFQVDSFGNISCLPAEVVELLNLRQKNVFGVQDCIEWIRKWFPKMTAKPASCVGSEAWTKMSYSLAVLKLSRLNEASSSEKSFLSACNIIREILRRISYEWHQSMQPHLLRMMRRDSAPASHAVLIVVDIETEEKHLILLLSDGWYVARAKMDRILQERVQRGKLRIGEKIHISGAHLQACNSNARPFFFGDGDEIGRSVLSLSANNVQKRRGKPFERLGIQRTGPVLNKLHGVLDECGVCPPAWVIVLRSYPVYFMERSDSDSNGTEEKMYVFLREDAEYEARATHAERLRQKAVSGKDMGKDNWRTDLGELSQRDVSSIKEVLVCGKSDNVKQEKTRKLVRIYNPTEDLQSFLSKEGGEFLMGHLWPKRNAWIGKPESIRPLKKNGNSPHLREFPRHIYSIHDMQSGKTNRGQEFDGVFCLLHVTDGLPSGNHRFVYFIDATGSQVGILALELNDSDSKSLPKIFRLNTKSGMPRLPLVALRDVEFQTVSPSHNLVHARSSMRSSFLSSNSLRQQKMYEELQIALTQLESELRGKDDQLEILREAVISFASGVRASVGAYFTSTQDM